MGCKYFTGWITEIGGLFRRIQTRVHTPAVLLISPVQCCSEPKCPANPPMENMKAFIRDSGDKANEIVLAGKKNKKR